MLSREELEQIPLRYRLLVKAFLKLPNPGIPFFIMRHFPEFEGILWGLVVPLSLGFFIWFDMWFVAFLSLHFSFPLNVIIGFLVPAIPFLFFLRIELERTILWWRNIHEQPKEWQISKKVDELIDLFNRQQKGKKS